MKRLECLSLLGPLIKDDDLVVTTLGWVAGEWFAVRHKESNLYQVNMGMCTPLCLGLALVLPHRRVVALESDGSVLLNLGAVTTLANKRPPNLTVIVFDNQCYMATGGLPHGNRWRHRFGRHGQRSRHRELLFGQLAQ